MIVEVYALEFHRRRMRNIASRADWIRLVAVEPRDRKMGRIYVFDIDSSRLQRFKFLMKKVYPKAKVVVDGVIK